MRRRINGILKSKLRVPEEMQSLRFRPSATAGRDCGWPFVDTKDSTKFQVMDGLDAGSKELRISRGTSPLEGWHLHVRQIIGNTRLSPHLSQALIRELAFRWNMRKLVAMYAESLEILD